MRNSWPAPAKLNLMLRIVGKRADGYHQLQTVFQFIDRQDELDFELRDDAEIRLQQPVPGVPSEQDLCLRAANALRQATGCRRGVDINLRKQLPMGGGLGGGSCLRRLMSTQSATHRQLFAQIDVDGWRTGWRQL